MRWGNFLASKNKRHFPTCNFKRLFSKSSKIKPNQAKSSRNFPYVDSEWQKKRSTKPKKNQKSKLITVVFHQLRERSGLAGCYVHIVLDACIGTLSYEEADEKPPYFVYKIEMHRMAWSLSHRM